MKKIMIVAAAALWGTVAFSVESGNIVGYNTLTLNNGGFTGLANSFVGISQTGLKVSALAPEGYFDFLDPDEMTDFTSINFAVIDKDGRGVKRYVWTHEFSWDSFDYGDEGAGYWVDFNTGDPVVADSANDWTVPAGQGLLWDAPELEKNEATATITFKGAGAVYTNTIPVVLNNGGFTMAGNPYPTGIKVSSLVPTGYFAFLDPDEMTDFTSINFAVIDKDGRGVKRYVWTHEFSWDSFDYGDEGAGYWVDFNTGDPVVADSANDWTVPAGQGLLWDAPEMEKDEATATISFSFYYPL